MLKPFELPHLTSHGLRHAFATMALRAGINPKVVSEALGHSTVTLDLYSHVLPNMQDELASAVASSSEADSFSRIPRSSGQNRS